MAHSGDRNRHNALFAAFEGILGDTERLHPLFCPVCALSLRSLLPDDSPTLASMQTKNHGLWDACMRNLVAPRSLDEETGLRARLQRNIDTCLFGRTAHESLLRRWNLEHVTDALVIFQTLLCVCLKSCLYGVSASDRTSDSAILARAKDPRKRFRSSAGVWPTNVDQLFPYGPAQTVLVLVTASWDANHDGPWWILNAILQLARPRVWPLLVGITYAQQRLLGACNVVIVHGTRMRVECGLLDNGDLAPAGVFVRRELVDAGWLRSGHGLNAAAVLLQTILMGPYSHPDDMYNFVLPQMDMCAAVYSLAIEKVIETHRNEWRTIIDCYLTASAKVQDARRRVTDIAVYMDVQRAPRSWRGTMLIRRALLNLHAQKRCSGPDCTKTTLDDDCDRPPLPTCAKCRLARYCSQECQRRDWVYGQQRSAQPIPHKRLCRVLIALENVTPVASSLSDDYTRKIQNSGVPDVDLALIALWAVRNSQHCRDLVRTSIAVNILDVAGRLESALSHEPDVHPRFCPICFLVFPYELRGDAPELPVLKKERPGLWDSCMRQLTCLRTIEVCALRRDALQRNIDGCPRNSTHQETLDWRPGPYLADPLELLDYLLCLSLYSCVWGIDSSTGSTVTVIGRSVARAGKTVRFRRRGLAHESRSALPLRRRAHLVALCCSFIDSGPWWVLPAVLNLARPKAWDVFMRAENHTRFVQALLALTLNGTGYTIYVPNGGQPNVEVLWQREGAACRQIALAVFDTLVLMPVRTPTCASCAPRHEEQFARLYDIVQTSDKCWSEVACASSHRRTACMLLPDAGALHFVEAHLRHAVVLHAIDITLSARPRARSVLRPGWTATRTLTGRVEMRKAAVGAS